MFARIKFGEINGLWIDPGGLGEGEGEGGGEGEEGDGSYVRGEGAVEVLDEDWGSGGVHVF